MRLNRCPVLVDHNISVYGEWMPDSNDEQMALINAKCSQNAPLMLYKKIG